MSEIDKKTWKTGYISPAGQFLNELETKPGASSESREAEEAKYQVIDSLRDEVQQEKPSKIWKGF